MSFGFGFGFTKTAIASAIATFSPSSLFTTGVNGAWYDPSDYSTLFQNAAGTTPVTAVEQPVGLMLDKSKGLVLGPELVMNGTFDTNINGFTLSNAGQGTILWDVSKALSFTNDGVSLCQVNYALSVSAGKWYRLSCDYTKTSGSDLAGISFSVAADTNTATSAFVTTASGITGSHSLYYLAASTTTVYVRVRKGSANVNTHLIDNISVRELPGNHATQSTTTSRPTLSARYNLLTKSEQFDDAAWTKSNSFVQTNQIRNNTMQGAVAGTPGTLPTNWQQAVISNLSSSIVGVGVEDGVSYIDYRLYGTTNASSSSSLQFEQNSAVSAANGQAWTLSTYLKVVAGSTSGISSIRLGWEERSTIYLQSDQGTNFTPASSGSLAANRNTFSFTLNNASTAYIKPYIQFTPVNGATIDLTIRIGMPQLVQGATAGDVVATYGTAKAVMYQAPDGTMSADKLVEDKATSGHVVLEGYSYSSATYTYSIYAKSGERTKTRLIAATGSGGVFVNADLSAGTVDAGAAFGTGFSVISSSILSLGNGWYRIALRFSATAGSGSVQSALLHASGNNSYTGDGTSGIYIWGADLRVANDGIGLPAYQRVDTATDYDTAGFPPYLKFDGTDDGMATGNIDFTATDKMFVAAGVRKLSDASGQFISEFSADISANNGGFNVVVPNTSPYQNFGFRSRGTTIAFADVTSNAYAAPTTNILTGLGNISGDSAILRVNGTQAASSTADQGTGNYGNYPLYIGRRGGTTLPFNGRLYSLVVCGKLASAAEIASTEAYINNKTKAY